LANAQSFSKELCRVLGVPEPDGKVDDASQNEYVFEADATLSDEGGHSIGRIDLYKRHHFILEAKQGGTTGGKKKGTAVRGTGGWAIAMQDAYGQALKYARGVDDEPPPFLIVTDVGYCFDLFACFDGSGAYRPFPNNQKNRIFLTVLGDHVDTLRTIWVDPYSLDPSLRAQAVTRDVAIELAELASSLESDGHAPELVSEFLM